MNDKEKYNTSFDAGMIEKYLQGKLSPAEMHAIEKAALDDPFLADAIDGMNTALLTKSSESLTADMNELRQRLHQRTAKKNQPAALVAYRSWWQAAAVGLVLVICGSVAYYFIYNDIKSKDSIAQENNRIAQPKTNSVTTTAPIPAAPEIDSNLSNDVVAKKPSVSKTTARKAKDSEPLMRKDSVSRDDAGAGIAIAPDEIARKKAAPAVSANQEAEKSEEDKSVASAPRTESFAPAGHQNFFQGKVTDEHNRPIAAASVELKDKKIAAVTDNNGNFKLKVQGSDSVVIAKVNSIGYEPAVSDLNSDGSTNIIVLRENKNNLQEVVTTGASRQRRTIPKQKTTQDAAPVHGWDDFNKYLEKNKKTPDDSLGLKGIVVVSFTVNKKGKLSDFAIEQSLGPDYDEEAIRVIREGPSWKLLKGKKANINVIVTY